ncbi:MAG: NAD-dependent epimerase/dehydratase family protein [Actinomycetota bacterium]
MTEARRPVLVTGATSLIGQHVVQLLLDRGERVRTLQRRSPQVADSAPESSVEHRAGDVADSAAVDAAMSGCDAVVHLAAKVGIMGARAEFAAANVDGTRHVVDAARRHGVTRVVHVSSPSVAHDGTPIIGDVATPALTEVRHGGWYSETKAIAERLALSAASDRLGVVAIRPHLVWGPGDTQLVGRIVERAAAGRLALVGGGTALVDTTYIDNAATALVAALDAVRPGARCSGRPYVVANGEPRPIRELVLGICAAAGIDAEPRDVPFGVARRVGGAIERLWPRLGRDDEPPLTRFLAEQLGTAHWFDPRPARDDLGWSPTVTIDEGLARLAESFSSAGAPSR